MKDKRTKGKAQTKNTTRKRITSLDPIDRVFDEHTGRTDEAKAHWLTVVCKCYLFVAVLRGRVFAVMDTVLCMDIVHLCWG